ncbi:MAG TPA: VanZ family protein [Candidatus Binataceae bacterium]
MKEIPEAAGHSNAIRLGRPQRLCLFVAVVALMYWLGTSLFSAARMQPLFYPILRSWFHVSAAGQLFYYLSLVRWTAHYLQYFGLLVFLVWILGLRPLTALLLCLLIALADEGHQYFLRDRSFSLFDLKLDAAGAATAFILTIVTRRMRAAAHPESQALPERTGPASA